MNDLETPLLRSKHYRPRDTTQHFRQRGTTSPNADTKTAARETKGRVRDTIPPIPETVNNDYVPWRDEANGVYE